MIMKKFNLIYLVAILICVLLLYSLFFKADSTVTFYGFADNKETEISMENAIEVEKIFVTVGQKVKKGTPLLNVVSATLPIKTSDVEYKIEELQTKYNLWKSDLDWRILQYEIELKEQTSKIQSQIDQLKVKLKNNKELSKKITSIDLVVSESKGITNPTQIKLASLELELQQTQEIIFTQINNLKSERFAQNNPILSEIKAQEAQLEYYKKRKRDELIVAPADGLIGNVHCKEGEKITSFGALISFYEESPNLVVGYIHEELILKINIDDSIAIYSSSRPDIQNKGVVKTLGSRIVEIPPRLRKIKELKTFGREIIIEIPPDNPFLQKEKVILNLVY